MDNQPNYYITGAFGFIGSHLVKYLNSKGITPYIIEPMDKIGNKWKNLAGADFVLYKSDNDFGENMSTFGGTNDFLIHLGANVDTTEIFNGELWRNNVLLSLNMFRLFNGKIIYASSAAIYGEEELEFSENRWDYSPLNAYAFTKYQLDKILFLRKNAYLHIDNICALRFFNVYGANEGHKGNMGSVINKWLSDEKLGKEVWKIKIVQTGAGFNEQKKEVKTNRLTLFKSLRSEYKDGEQMRDFVYVGDICKVIWHITQKAEEKSTKFNGLNFRSGIFNLGSGTATTWNTVAKNVLKVRGLSDSLIEYGEMPDNLRNQYQYHTKADLTKLRDILGYKEKMTSIEEGIRLTWEELNK